MTDPDPVPRRQRRSWAWLLPAALAILAAGATLVFWPERVDRWHLLAAAGASLAIALAAAIASGGPTRRRLAVLAGLGLLALIAPVAGAAGWYLRDRARRAGLVWEALGPRAGGVSGVREALERGDRPTARALLLEDFRGRAPAAVDTLPAPESAKVVKASDQLVDGVIEIFSGRPVRIGKDVDWGADPFNDRTWQWFLQAMDYLLALTERHRATGDLRYLERAEELILDWIDDNYLYRWRPASGLAWHDHTTAVRVRAWLSFWEPWVRSPLADGAKVEKLLSAIAAHAGKLADPDFYTADHNHGLEQDLALMAVSRAFPEFARSGEWERLACARLERTAANTISPAGVHLEHSANYHLFTLGILTRARDFAKRHGLPCGSSLDGTLERMARYAAYLLQPDGREPLLGDTELADPYPPDDPVLSRYAERDPVLRYSLTRGREGTPGEAAVVYPAEGYAILRDAWHGAGDFDQGLYLLFAAAAHPGRAHKQADDLSFILFARGRELIADAGLYGYDARDPFRRHVVSAAAHNVVLVDGAPFTGYATRMERHRLEAAYALVEAVHENYPGIRHRRTLAYVRPWTLFVIDELEPTGAGVPGDQERLFEQLFHLAPDLEAAPSADRSSVGAWPPGDGGGVGTPAGRADVLRITQLAAGRGTAAVVKGARDPLRGWLSRDHHQITPAPVAIFSARGASATFITWIEVAPAPLAGDPRSAAEPGAKRITIEWPAGGGVRRTVIDRGGDFRLELTGG